MTRAPTDRSHLSIGEVLSLLQEEFPDVTISKIRFLESQGLLDPERTPSGYRKFYEGDIERLRKILTLQKDHYLPLKVIKARLDEPEGIRPAPTDAGPDRRPAVNGTTDPGTPSPGPANRAALEEPGQVAVAVDEQPARAAPPGSERVRAAGEERGAARPAGAADAGAGVRSRSGRRRRPDVADVIEGPAPPPAAADTDPTIQLPRPRRTASRSGASRAASDVDREVSLTAEELCQASGLPARGLRELEGYGLVEPHVVGDTSYYDADALVVARTYAAFREHGIEARHIRAYKVAAEREAGLYEQIVLPLLKQRNPEARQRAAETVAELVRLGDQMRSVLLRRNLRDLLPPRVVRVTGGRFLPKKGCGPDEKSAEWE